MPKKGTCSVWEWQLCCFITYLLFWQRELHLASDKVFTFGITCLQKHAHILVFRPAYVWQQTTRLSVVCIREKLTCWKNCYGQYRGTGRRHHRPLLLNPPSNSKYSVCEASARKFSSDDDDDYVCWVFFAVVSLRQVERKLEREKERSIAELTASRAMHHDEVETLTKQLQRMQADNNLLMVRYHRTSGDLFQRLSVISYSVSVWS